MKPIILTKDMKIRKLGKTNVADHVFVEELKRDEAIKKYFLSFDPMMENERTNDSSWVGTYAVMKCDQMVGSLEIYTIEELQNVLSLSYIILERYRKQGYGKELLRSISDKLLEEINSLALVISQSNLASQKVALDAGFYPVSSVIYQKTKMK